MADNPPELTTLPVRNMQICFKNLDGIWDEPEIEVYHILVNGMWITFEETEYSAIKTFVEELQGE
jgi:hypothetical protein